MTGANVGRRVLLAWLVLAASPVSAWQATPEPLRVGGAIPEPRKLVDAPAIYPEAARSVRLQGRVILDCVVSPSGDVVEARVTGSIPLFDAAAIAAVRQWRYAPTVVNGVALPVVFAVAVDFKLDEAGPGAPPAPGATAPAAAVAPAATEGTVVVYWPRSFWGVPGGIELSCDDVHLADLDKNRRFQFTAAPGRRRVGFESALLQLDVVAGQTHYVRVTVDAVEPRLEVVGAAEAEKQIRDKDIGEARQSTVRSSRCGLGQEQLRPDR